MVSTLKLCFILTIITAFTACSSKWVSNDLFGQLNSGMSSEETMLVFDNEPDERISLSLDNYNHEYEVHFYKRRVFFSNYLYTRSFYDYVVLSFRDGGLFFWGPIDDFKTNNNQEIEQLGNLISEYMYVEL